MLGSHAGDAEYPLSMAQVIYDRGVLVASIGSISRSFIKVCNGINEALVYL